MRLTIRDIRKMKTGNQPIVMLTAYDATSARICEAADIPMLLIGDSMGMVIQGHDSTIPVTMEQIVYHCQIVSRVTSRPLLVGDLPFMSYHVSDEQALQNAARLVQEGRVECVKLEGGESVAPTIQKIVESGIPVMGHIGLTPQGVNQFGGFRVQGRKLESARKLLQDAYAVEKAGAFAMVVELVPSKLAKFITERVSIPTIGIGAGIGCDGQVQVFHDILGIFDDFKPRHAKRYAEVGDMMRNAVEDYKNEVLEETFPAEENSFDIDESVIEALEQEDEQLRENS